ncbi:MAG: cation:proton antiporter subunit C [Hyphomonadaceae bacterium]
MLQFILERANYWAIIGLMMVGLYIAFQSANMIKKLVGLSIFQTSVFLLYITLGKVAGGSAPILFGRDAAGHGEADAAHSAEVGTHGAEAGHGATSGLIEVYSNPLPHVLILTAIVVGVATLAVGLALVVRIRESYGSIESDEVRAMDIVAADAQDADDAVEAVG